MGYAPDYVSAIEIHNRIAGLPLVDSSHLPGDPLTVIDEEGKAVGVAFGPREARRLAIRHARRHISREETYYTALEYPGHALFGLVEMGR